jgi:hypothetical protein
METITVTLRLKPDQVAKLKELFAALPPGSAWLDWKDYADTIAATSFNARLEQRYAAITKQVVR